MSPGIVCNSLSVHSPADSRPVRRHSWLYYTITSFSLIPPYPLHEREKSSPQCWWLSRTHESQPHQQTLISLGSGRISQFVERRGEKPPCNLHDGENHLYEMHDTLFPINNRVRLTKGFCQQNIIVLFYNYLQFTSWFVLLKFHWLVDLPGISQVNVEIWEPSGLYGEWGGVEGWKGPRERTSGRRTLAYSRVWMRVCVSCWWNTISFTVVNVKYAKAPLSLYANFDVLVSNDHFITFIRFASSKTWDLVDLTPRHKLKHAKLILNIPSW